MKHQVQNFLRKISIRGVAFSVLFLVVPAVMFQNCAPVSFAVKSKDQPSLAISSHLDCLSGQTLDASGNCVGTSSASNKNGQCGASDGIMVATVPSTGLCIAGSQTQVSGSGPWNWSCLGSGGGLPANCSAKKTVGVLNGQCGTNNGLSLSTAPVASLCLIGMPSAVTGVGPWSWSCPGTGGGSSAACSAKKAALTPCLAKAPQYRSSNCPTGQTGQYSFVSNYSCPTAYEPGAYGAYVESGNTCTATSGGGSGGSGGGGGSGPTQIAVNINIVFDKLSYNVGEAITGHVSLDTNVTFTGDVLFSGSTDQPAPFNIPYPSVQFYAGSTNSLTFSQINGGSNPTIGRSGDYNWSASVTVGGKSFTTTRVVHIGTSSTSVLSYMTSIIMDPGPYKVNNQIGGQYCINSNRAFIGNANGVVTGPSCAGNPPINIPINYFGVNIPQGGICYPLATIIGTSPTPPCEGLYSLSINLTAPSEGSVGVTYDVYASP